MNTKTIIVLSVLVLFLFSVAGVITISGQEPNAAGIPFPAGIKFEITEPGHPWRPPFGVDRVGRSCDVMVTFQSKELPAGDFILAGIMNGKEVSRNTIHLINKPPASGIINGTEEADQFTFYSVSNPDKKDITFSGRPLITGNIDHLVLLFAGKGKNPAELARQSVSLRPFEAEAAAIPDKIINPVDLGAILVPDDWLLLTGGQKAYLKIAALSRKGNIPGSGIMAWYNSAPQNKVNEQMPVAGEKLVLKELSLPACSKVLTNDILNVSIADAQGKQLWHKQIMVMIVPGHQEWPDFGALFTKLRYDPSIINIVNGKNDSLDYNNTWAPELKDLVVFFPNGSRFVFWRGTSYIPVWAGKYNTCLSYEWAERISPNIGFTDCPEPLMDKELRYSRVEIIESTAARVHIRWSYQSCDFNYKVNGDLPVEDYFFYPDGFGTRVLTLRSIPEAEYELAEFIILAPQAAFPLNFVPREPVDIISLKTGEKRSIQLPEADETWKKMSDPAVYRVRLNKNELLSAISFNPDLVSKPLSVFKPFYDKGFIVTPAYWGGHWPLSRGFNTMAKINESIWAGPSHNSLMSWVTNRPKPVRSIISETKDAFGTLKTMKEETWIWLIGMSNGNDEELRHIASGFATPPSLQLDGAILDPEPKVSDKRAMQLVVEKKRVLIKIKPASWCVNPVFELQNAPEKLKTVNLDGKILDPSRYAWDGHIFWLSATTDKTLTLELLFKE